MIKRPHHQRAAIGAALMSSLLFGACQSGPPARAERYEFGQAHQGAPLLARWLSGDHTGARDAAARIDATTGPLEARFVAAEIVYWDGDLEQALERYLAMLAEAPAHPLARIIAARLSALSGEVVNFEGRASQTLGAIKLSQAHPMTGVSLLSMGQRVGWTRWRRGEEAAPFDGAPYGLLNQWRVSPAMSPWRLLDLDRPLPQLDDAPALPDTIRAPWFATDEPAHQARVKPLQINNIALSPKLPSTGVYVLETFIRVSGEGPQVYWIYGNFPMAARVYVQDEEVLRRDEEDYSAGRSLRRVTLSPGLHRVRVKLAYQRGYRDWFDLGLMRHDATALSGSGLTQLMRLPDGEQARGAVSLLSEAKAPDALQAALLVPPAEVKAASDVALYLSAAAAHEDRQGDYVAPAIEELLRRHPEAAALHAIHAAHVKSLWEVPSRLRQAQALGAMRRAYTLAPDSPRHALALGAWLSDRGGKDDEARRLLEQARAQAVSGPSGAEATARLRHARALNAWPQHLQERGFDEAAELAWRQALTIAPESCGAAERLQLLLYGRGAYLRPEAITPQAPLCPALQERYEQVIPGLDDARLARATLRAKRAPLDEQAQLEHASALRHAGKPEEARQALRQAIAHMGDAPQLIEALAEALVEAEGVEAARALMDEATARHGARGALVWQRALLEGEVPLLALLRDGEQAAREAIETERASAQEALGDDAYYVIDFAAKQYYPDGSGIALTHTLVRVMTKSGIDRYGEVQVPGGARVLRARTIKADGTTLAPEQTAGKEALSMPGLAEGDLVELAYLEFESAPEPVAMHHIGTRFFFKMRDISSSLSEYVVIDPPGELIGRNGPPQAQKFTYEGRPAVRYLQRRSPRPRQEPSSVGADEHLPWVQLMRSGVTIDPVEASLRTSRDAAIDHGRLSEPARAQLNAWRASAPQGDGEARAKALFYQINAAFPNPSGGPLTGDLSHAVLSREGNPLLAMWQTYRLDGMSADIYLARTAYDDPEVHPLTEGASYARALLRVAIPGTKRVVWLSTGGPDVMFDALPEAYLGQPALCVTCEVPHREVLPARSARPGMRDTQISAKLDAKGALTGEVIDTFEGVRAVQARGALRQRVEPIAREKLMGALLAEHLPGATLTGYTLEGEGDADAPLSARLTFSLAGFARPDGGGALSVIAPLFADPIASAYASLGARTSPMLIAHDRHQRGRITIAPPAGQRFALSDQRGELKLERAFGSALRRVDVDDAGALVVESSIAMPIQRVAVAQYQAFRQWAIAVEQSGLVRARVSAAKAK